jgi:hypothetical protein
MIFYYPFFSFPGVPVYSGYPAIPYPIPNPTQFERQVLRMAKKLGVATEEPLSERVRTRLAGGQFEMAVIEYRRETGAGLESAFHAVQAGGKLDVEANFNRVLAELDRRFPDPSPT